MTRLSWLLVQQVLSQAALIPGATTWKEEQAKVGRDVPELHCSQSIPSVSVLGVAAYEPSKPSTKKLISVVIQCLVVIKHRGGKTVRRSRLTLQAVSANAI